MTNPIKPHEVANHIRIPDAVIEAFNELIAERFTGSRAVVPQEDVIARILTKLGGWHTKQQAMKEIFEKGWLNVEGAYREAGWDVEYDKPGYDETYPATFTFKLTNE